MTDFIDDNKKIPRYMYLAYGTYPNGDYAYAHGTQKDGVLQLFKEQNPKGTLLGIVTYNFLTFDNYAPAAADP